MVGDSRGQSEILGAILVFGFVVALIGINQAFLIPPDNADIEAQHDRVVQSEIVDIRGEIIEAAGTNNQRSVSIQLGTDYPRRFIGLNPSAATGTLESSQLDGEIAVDFDGDDVIGDDDERVDSLSDVCGTDDMTTYSLTYEANYNEYQSGLPMKVENTVAYRQAQEPLFDSNQIVIKENTIRIVRVVGDYSATGSGTENVDFFPSEETGKVFVEEVEEVRLPTDLSADKWEALLEDERAVDEENIQESNGNVEIPFAGEFDSYTIECTTVGIEEQPDVNPIRNVDDQELPDVNLNPTEPLELTSVDENGGLNLEFTNLGESFITLQEARIPFVTGPGKSAGDEITFENGGETQLTIGGEAKEVDGVNWESSSPSNTQIITLSDFGEQNTGVALELRVEIDGEETEEVSFIYFVSRES